MSDEDLTTITATNISEELVNRDGQSPELSIHFESRSTGTPNVQDTHICETESSPLDLDRTFKDELIEHHRSSTEEATPEEIVTSALKTAGATESKDDAYTGSSLVGGITEAGETLLGGIIASTGMGETKATEIDHGIQLLQGVTESGELLLGGVKAAETEEKEVNRETIQNEPSQPDASKMITNLFKSSVENKFPDHEMQNRIQTELDAKAMNIFAEIDSLRAQTEQFASEAEQSLSQHLATNHTSHKEEQQLVVTMEQTKPTVEKEIDQLKEVVNTPENPHMNKPTESAVSTNYTTTNPSGTSTIQEAMNEMNAPQKGSEESKKMVEEFYPPVPVVPNDQMHEEAGEINKQSEMSPPVEVAAPPAPDVSITTLPSEPTQTNQAEQEGTNVHLTSNEEKAKEIVNEAKKPAAVAAAVTAKPASVPLAEPEGGTETTEETKEEEHADNTTSKSQRIRQRIRNYCNLL